MEAHARAVVVVEPVKYEEIIAQMTAFPRAWTQKNTVAKKENKMIARERR